MAKNSNTSKPKNAKSRKSAANVIANDVYHKALARLHVELVKMQEWVHKTGEKIVVIFEGRDAAGKGGVIKRITEPLNPRVCQVVALPAPTERECPSRLELGHYPEADEWGVKWLVSGTPTKISLSCCARSN